jgi:lysophospholipase L1-like esterase
MILQEAVNDIGYSASAEDLIAGHREVIAQARAQGVKVYGGTILPFKGSFIWTEEREATWRALNDWIRTSGEFDGVVDFAAATAVPGDPATLNPVYDSGDHLHPNDAGTEAMANAVDLAMLLGR